MTTASPLPTLYKFLDANQTGRHSRKRLPIGEWITVDGPLRMCNNGIHVTTVESAVRWLDERAHLVEIRGEHIVGDDKLCCREVLIHPALPHWTRETIVRFAADCAERVLPIFEAKYPNDDRPRKAVEAARSGDAQRARAASAAAAAYAAADAASAYAAYASASAYAAYAAADAAASADAASAYAYAAYASASAYAAYAAASAYAAYAAADAAERKWQSERLAALLLGGAE